MAKKIKYLLNESQNEELELPCMNCANKTSHKAIVTVDVRGHEGDEERYSIAWSDDHQIVQCLGCKSLSFRIASSNSEDYNQYEDGDGEYNVIETLFPARKEGRKGIGQSTVYLPMKIRLVYLETLIALSVQAPILSAIGLRTLIEAVCQEKNAKGVDLYNRIDNLVELQILTPASASILHKIRALGNSAAHEALPHSDKQLELAMDIVEHMLKDVYILPKLAESEFKSDPSG